MEPSGRGAAWLLSRIVCLASVPSLAFGFVSVGFSVDLGCFLFPAFFFFFLNIGIRHTTWLTNGMPVEWMMVTLHRNISPLRAAMCSTVLGKTQMEALQFLTFDLWLTVNRCVSRPWSEVFIYLYIPFTRGQFKSGLDLFSSLLIQWNNA